MTTESLIPTNKRSHERYHIGNTPLRRFLTPPVKTVFSLLARTTATGVEHLPARGPVVLTANHLTNFDVFPIQFVLPRLIFYMGKEELFRNPLLDAVLSRLGGFPVYRGAKDQWAMEHAYKVLELGQMLGIFPEGTRSKGRGLRPAKTGAAHLAIQVGAPLVPLAITGTQDIPRSFPRRAQVIIRVGPPLYPRPDEGPVALTDRVMFALAELLPPELRGAYAHHPPGF